MPLVSEVKSLQLLRFILLHIETQISYSARYSGGLDYHHSAGPRWVWKGAINPCQFHGISEMEICRGLWNPEKSQCSISFLKMGPGFNHTGAFYWEMIWKPSPKGDYCTDFKLLFKVSHKCAEILFLFLYCFLGSLNLGRLWSLISSVLSQSLLSKGIQLSLWLLLKENRTSVFRLLKSNQDAI